MRTTLPELRRLKRSVTVAVSERRSVTRAPRRIAFRRRPGTAGAAGVTAGAAARGGGDLAGRRRRGVPDGPGVAAGGGVGTGVSDGGGVGSGVGVGSTGSPVTVIVPVMFGWTWQTKA